MNKINYNKLAPEILATYMEAEKLFQKHLSIEKSLVHLIKIRASQLNGCAFCINMHTEEALKDGEAKERIFLLSVYHETGELFSIRERLALMITERVTLISEYGMDEDVLKDILTIFTEKEYVDILLIINQINAWNRLSIATIKPYK